MVATQRIDSVRLGDQPAAVVGVLSTMMAHVEPGLLEILLHRAEGDTLDFKREQYRYARATDEERGELLKDVLAFANAWRTEDAFIVIGAAENAGGRATLTGVGPAGHIDDAELQRFVNAKTNVPVAFEYVPVAVDGVQIGIIRVRADQQRPVFVAKQYGKVKPNVVYVRRGSHTAEAAPDEVARMGASRTERAREPGLVVQFGDWESEERIGLDARVMSRVLRARSGASDPESRDEALDGLKRQIAEHWSFAVGASLKDSREWRDYVAQLALLSPLAVVVENTGGVLAEDLRVQFDIEGRLTLLDRKPGRPFLSSMHGLRTVHVPTPTIHVNARRWTEVEQRGPEHWRVMMRLGKVQPGAVVWSAPFWVGAAAPCKQATTVRVFGDNLPRALSIDASIDISVEHGWLEEYDDDDDDDDDDE